MVCLLDCNMFIFIHGRLLMVQQHGFSCRGNAGRLMAIARLRQSGLQQVVILSIASSGT